MELVFLGTGAGMPSRERNVSSIALSWLPSASTFWLFDAGEATQHQLWDAGLSLHRLERIYITHLHGDHVYGLPGLLGSRSAAGVQTELILYGPSGLKTWIETTLQCTHVHLGYPLRIEEAEPGADRFVVHQTHGVTVEAAWLDHVVPSLGYRVTEPDSPGTLDTKALADAGIPPGPLYGQLKRREVVDLADGRQVCGRDFVGPDRPGRIVAILGDTQPCAPSVGLAQGADMLVHEATFAQGLETNAANYGHSTASSAARIAQEAHCRRLILTHISARYDSDGAKELLGQAKAIFPETEMARDGSRFPIPNRL